MFTTESPLDMRFFTWAYLIVEDVHERKRIEWIDDSTHTGSRIGTLRDFINSPDSMSEARIRVTLDSGWEHEVMLVDLMNAKFRNGYARL